MPAIAFITSGLKFLVRPGLPGLISVVALLLSSCDFEDSGNEAVQQAPVDTRLSIFAVNYPLAYFAERIGRDLVKVSLPVPADTDPAGWQPSPETIIEFQQADLILLNGAGYARWVESASLPNNRVVDTSRSFRDRLIRLADTTHSHGPEGDHSHGAMASSTWLDPELALEQARAIRDALVTYRPEKQTEIDSHFSGLERDLAALDEQLSAAFALMNEQGILYSHPVYQYLARRFTPTARSLNWEPDVVPGEGELQQLRDSRAEQTAGVLIWEREPYSVTVELLEKVGLRSAAFDLVSNRPASGDYLTRMQWNLENLSRVATPPSQDLPTG
ncbi:MAG: metal ABC transporter substrate-binding protein [Gammaproteobacteria bacterium]